MANSIPRAEHPNPQFERESWLNLNGEWEFEIDNSVSGRERGLQNAEHLSSKIIVPFCPESRLSGVENTDFMNCVWYRRDIEISESELEGIVILHFGAVDYDATVYINGEEAMHHKGGYVSFAGDITKFLKAGKNSIAVEARDDVRNPLIPRGKQSERLHSHDCDYTRTTGIWQTVWVEFVPKSYIKSIKLFPNPESSSVAFSCELCGSGELGIDVLYEGKLVGRYDCKNAAGCVSGDMKLIEKHLWEVGCGRLYNLVITFGGDTVKSYFGLRDVRLDGFKYLINGKSVFQRLVLDQGFYRVSKGPSHPEEKLPAQLPLLKRAAHRLSPPAVFRKKHRRQCQEEAYRSRVCSWIHLRSSVIFIRYASFLFFMIFCFNPQSVMLQNPCHWVHWDGIPAAIRTRTGRKSIFFPLFDRYFCVFSSVSKRYSNHR